MPTNRQLQYEALMRAARDAAPGSPNESNHAYREAQRDALVILHAARNLEEPWAEREWIAGAAEAGWNVEQQRAAREGIGPSISSGIMLGGTSPGENGWNQMQRGGGTWAKLNHDGTRFSVRSNPHVGTWSWTARDAQSNEIGRGEERSRQAAQRKAEEAAPGSGGPRAAAEFIRAKIAQLRREGYPQTQAVAIANEEARKAGYSGVPESTEVVLTPDQIRAAVKAMNGNPGPSRILVNKALRGERKALEYIKAFLRSKKR